MITLSNLFRRAISAFSAILILGFALSLGEPAESRQAAPTATPAVAQGDRTEKAGQAALEAKEETETREIAKQAYIFAYPLVVVEMTRRTTTMGGDLRFLHRFRHEQAFPEDRFRQVIRPNADTLYSAAWFDLSKEPTQRHNTAQRRMARAFQ